jgi:diacylglycerol O-acyltransferase / trehalose O-mycolyltransferase
MPARVVAKKRLADREEDLTIESPALGSQTKVRLLLPAHYETQRARLWPVLYLLHGCCDSYVSWTRSTDIEQLTERSDIIVVMPDAGKAGFYSDWQSGPGWETFHTSELPRLLAQQYRGQYRRGGGRGFDGRPRSSRLRRSPPRECSASQPHSAAGSTPAYPKKSPTTL